jgi:mannosyl-oligosaccharide alpha-1,2-mannosidase
VRDTRYILRPEAIESIFLLYRMTGKEDLRDLAWRMWESIMKATETPLGNSAIADVTVKGETSKMDSMEVRDLGEKGETCDGI